MRQGTQVFDSERLLHSTTDKEFYTTQIDGELTIDRNTDAMTREFSRGQLIPPHYSSNQDLSMPKSSEVINQDTGNAEAQQQHHRTHSEEQERVNEAKKPGENRQYTHESSFRTSINTEDDAEVKKKKWKYR